MTLTRESILRLMQQNSYRPLTYEELRDELKVEDDIAFARLVGRMDKEGDIVITRKNRYGLPEMMNLVRGALQVNPRGYAFLIPDEPGQDDVYIYGRDLNGAMHNDRVMVRISQRSNGNGQKPEGEVIRAIKRANTEVVGTYKRGKVAQVVPDDPRLIYPINVRPTKRIKLRDGDKVLAHITAWPDKNKYPEGKIVEVLGARGDPGVDIRCIIKKYGLKEAFPPDVLNEAITISQAVTPEDLEGRRDLRDIMMVTIDGDDAKDLDDAVSLVRTETGYRLGVHIADVSHYVKEESALNK
ncbi:MAG: RNB domain-containing ribonuclease, partial [Chitinophagales bacterium]